MKKAGTMIIVVGLLLTIFAGAKIVTKKKVVEIGNLEITRDKHHYLEWSPLIGIVVMIAGVCVYFYADRKP